MDLKKDWAKLVSAILMGVLGLLFAIELFAGNPSGLDYLDMPAKIAGVSTGALTIFLGRYLVPTLFFLGMCVYYILKMLKVEHKKWLLLCLGALNLILMLVAVFSAPEIPGVTALELMTSWVPLVLFALLPLIKGIKKVCCNKEESSKK